MLTVIFNAILAVGVIVMVVTPLAWAILTQHRDYPRQLATDGATMRAPRAATVGRSTVRSTSPSFGRA
jgi:hypothetical protein